MSIKSSDIMDITECIDNIKLKDDLIKKENVNVNINIENILLKNGYIKMIRKEFLDDNIKKCDNLTPNPNKNSFKSYIKLIVKKLFKSENTLINLYLNFVEEYIKINHELPYLTKNNIFKKLTDAKNDFIKTLYFNIVNYNIKHLIDNENYNTYNKKEYNLKQNIKLLKSSVNCDLSNKEFFKFIIIYILNNDENIISNITNSLNKFYNNDLDKIINKIIEKEYYINSKNYLDTDLYDKTLKKYCNSFNCVKTCDICFNEKNEYFNRFCCNNNIICVSCSVEHIVKSEKNGCCPFCNDTNFRKDFNYIQNKLIKNLLKI